jgi:hypothetical protein
VTQDHRPDTAASPFLVEHYQDWSDYPGWDAYEDDEGNEIRFATVAEGRAWIDRKREADNADAVAAWERSEARVKAARQRHADRTRLLDEAGLGKQDGEHQVLWGVPAGYKKPEPESAKKFRVVLDAPCCPTCGGRATAQANKEAESG